ncbi:MAG: radical SAM family heme chaperone HemW [Muribaculaceae bacterium]|nr:radical SAM family heme chaperone HemW [Muribaculaceae bacterium]
MNTPISLYFHVPYCNNKCIYCDFYSGGARIADWSALASSFLNELRSRRSEWEGREVVSIYFGGGTPSLMPVDIFSGLLSEIKDMIGTCRLAADCEITLEANPEDVNPEAVDYWKQSGVNRVSLGVQTFSDNSLRSIGRRHSGEEARRALELLTSEFKNVSADLIFGLPNQKLPDLRQDLVMLTSLSPEHISVYSLMYEPGTALTYLRDSGKIAQIGEEEAAEMFDTIVATLEGVGYDRYETSNYARPGYKSRHNSGYWTGRAYVGIGPSAHSFDGVSLRKANPADLKSYISHWSAWSEGRPDSVDYPIEREHLTPEERREEMLMLGLRMKKGLDLNLYETRFGSEALRTLLLKARPAIDRDQLRLTPDSRLCITDSALMISDTLLLTLL